MITISCKLVGASPYSQSAPIQSVRNTGEAHDAFEARVWREHIHANENGECFIPPMALKNCLAEAAKFLGESVPGKGKATYTKHFEAGILVIDPLMLGVMAKDVPGERLFLPSDGVRGSGKRVWKTYPVIKKWEATATIIVLDPLLIDKPQKIKEYLEHAGKFIGLGRFRPRQNGYYGRFTVENFKVNK